MMPRQAAVMLIAAKLRVMGDVPGHEFHGNQYTAGFHGTSSDKLDSILKEGLRPDKQGDTYLTSSLSIAQNYAKEAHGFVKGFVDRNTHGIVLEVRIPKSEKAKISSRGGAIQFKGQVKPEWIRVHSTSDRHIKTWRTAESRFAAFNRDNTAIHKAADAHFKPMMLAISYAFMKGKKAVDKSRLRSATTERQLHEAMDAAPAAVKAALLQSLPTALAACLKAGGQAGLESLTRPKKSSPRAAAAGGTGSKNPFNIRFDVESEDATAWAKEHAGELAKNLSDTSREDIQEAIASALEGEGLDSAYDDILDSIGNEARAELIARTEIMDAANEGLAQSWGQAVEAGLLTGDEKKVWIATSDACPECEEVDGEEVPIDDDFSVGDDPPLHPNCRCTMGLTSE